MAKKFLVNIDMGGNQILSPRVHNATTSPTAYGKGQLWYDSTNNQLNVYDGSAFQPLATGGTAVSSLNSFTGGVNIYGTTNQITVTNSSGSITLSLPSTVSVTTACATNFYGAFNGNATTATNASSANYATSAGNASTVTNGVYTTDTGTVTSAMIANGTILDADINAAAGITVSKLSASNVTIGSTAVGLGGTATTIAGLTKVTSASITVSDTTDATSTTSAPFLVSGGAGVSKNLYVGGNLNVSGSVYVSGSAFTVSSSNIQLNDPLLYLAHNNPADTSDIGIVGSFNNGTYQHTGLARDASDGIWKLFSGVTTEPNTTINFASATYSTLQTGGLIINSSSTTTTASITAAGAATFLSIAKSGGTSSQFLKADGTVDTTTYAPLASPTFTGTVNLGTNIATGSVATATNASQLDGTAASAYAQLSSANFTAASVGSIAVARKYAGTITGDNATASFSLSHNMNTRDVMVRVYQTSATPDTQYSDVEVDIERTTASAVKVTFATAPATGVTYNVVVVG